MNITAVTSATVNNPTGTVADGNGSRSIGLESEFKQSYVLHSWPTLVVRQHIYLSQMHLRTRAKVQR